MGTVRKVMGVIAVVGMLAGCASTPPPEFSQRDYEGFATTWVGLHRCVEQSDISPDLGAFGVGLMRSELSGYAYSPQFLEATIKRTEQEIPAVPKEGCNHVALITAERKRQVAINNSVADQDRESIEEALEYVRDSKPVFCNQIGDVTLCN